MSGLDGGGSGGISGGSTNTSAGTGGEDVSVKNQQVQRARSHQEQSDNLDARIQQKRLAAERGETAPTPPAKGSPAAQGQAQRGPDGKFLPQDPHKAPDPARAQASTSAGDDKTVSPDAHDAKPADVEAAPKADPAHEKLKAEHATVVKERDTLADRNKQWDKIGEAAMARMDSQKAYIARLESALQEKGGSIDPMVLENTRLQERVRAIEMAEERAAAEHARQQQAAAEAQRTQEREQLTSETKAALSKFPALFKSGPDLKEYLTLVWRGGDPTTLAEVYNQRVEKRSPQSTSPQIAPRTLAGRGSGSGGPKLTDPRDIADKWKRTLPGYA